MCFSSGFVFARFIGIHSHLPVTNATQKPKIGFWYSVLSKEKVKRKSYVKCVLKTKGVPKNLGKYKYSAIIIKSGMYIKYSATNRMFSWEFPAWFLISVFIPIFQLVSNFFEIFLFWNWFFLLVLYSRIHKKFTKQTCIRKNEWIRFGQIDLLGTLWVVNIQFKFHSWFCHLDNSISFFVWTVFVF